MPIQPRCRLCGSQEPMLLDPKVYHVGDVVALIAADTVEIAEEAVDLIKVEYEQLEPVYSAEEALKEGAPELYKRFPGNQVDNGIKYFQPDGPWWQIIRGDVKKGFEEADYVAEDKISFSKMPAPLAPETPSCIAQHDGGDNYTIWASSQSAHIMNCGCYSVNASDIAPVLVALDADIVTTKKVIKATAFFTTKLAAYDMYNQTDHFSFFDQGGLDVAVFGLSEVEETGNVNTTFLNGKMAGVGGFPNIAANAKHSLFVGTFTASGLKCHDPLPSRRQPSWQGECLQRHRLRTPD